MFRSKLILKRLGRIEDDLEDLNDRMSSVGDFPSKQIEVTWVDKQKTMIVCNNCNGTGKESYSNGWYSNQKRKCRFCNGRKVIKLIDKSKVKK